MRRGRGSRGAGKRSIDLGAPDEADEVTPAPKRRSVPPPPNRIPKNATAVQPSSVQANSMSPVLRPPPPSPVETALIEQPDPSYPINAQLLSNFGGFNSDDLMILDIFFGWSTRFCEEGVVQGLLKLSVRMRVALERHRVICNDLSAANGRVDSLHNANMAAQNLIDEIRVENSQLKVVYFVFISMH